MSALRLRNTLTGELEEFAPAGSPVTMYVCGPTVYGEPHVGNARPVVVFDVLYRLLRHDHDAVSYARNITDIDDKIIAAAKAEGVEASSIAERYEASFRRAAEALGNLTPDHEPRATEHIGGMVGLAQCLIDAGCAYAAEGHVLFSVASFPGYGRLSNRSRDEMIAGARVEVAPYKKDPADFVLWKPSREGEPGWGSPWGRGRPGWHLECSAMIKECLGDVIDIHGGGSDLAFPHHENEIAQSCCAFGQQALARFWLHNGAVTQGGSKMAKSTGNLVMLNEALEEHHGEVIRYALLSAHYRSPLDWSGGTLSEAKSALTRLYRAMGAEEPPNGSAPDETFLDELRNDLNTPRAFARLHELASQVNRSEGGEAQRLRARLRATGRWLGLLGQQPDEWLRGSGGADAISDERIEELIELRRAARAGGDYAEADRLRDELAAAGVRLEDRGGGTAWSRR